MKSAAVHTSFVDHERCAQEQVQLIGQIQPHGVLFALSEPDLVVRQVSTSVSSILGLSPEAVLDHSFETVLGADQFESIRSEHYSQEAPCSSVLRVAAHGRSLEVHAAMYRQDDVLIVELEPTENSRCLDPLDIDAHVHQPLRRMREATDIASLATVAAREVRILSGFQRVMAYRFDKAWNGEVIAEVVDGSPVSYFGLRFPAGDIPPQVRRLFLLNPMRAIADIDAVPAAIVPAIASGTAKPLDLTRSVLRSASPIHLEYLRNMGVRSSLTLSIIVRDRLWGMIACHDPAPLLLGHSTRSVCELIGQTLAGQVTLLLDNGTLESRVKIRSMLDEIMAGIEASESLASGVVEQSARLCQLLDADGMISVLDGQHFSCGDSLSAEKLARSIDKLRNLPSAFPTSSDELGSLDPDLTSSAKLASGALYVGLSAPGEDHLIFLRRELIETITWAGNPNKTVTADEHDRLHPRVSFDAWQETVQGRSRPWKESELECAGLLREQLDRLRAARDLIRANESLNREIVERRRIEAELELARKNADAANQSKSAFLANMSHEIRTPMNGVLGMLQLLLDTDPGAQQRHYVEVAVTSGMTLLRLIDDVLDLSKVEAHKIELEREVFDLPRAIEDTVEILRVKAVAKGIAMGLNLSPDTPRYVRGDVHRLRQILTNLAGNAVKFTAQGSVTIHVNRVDEQNGEATVRFSVVDTGIGIPPDRIHALFSPFVQADASTTRKYGGTGLGLAISKQLAELMGGKIAVSSQPGQGTTFWFAIPFEIAAEPLSVARNNQPARTSRTSATMQTDALLAASGVVRVLIAEDNAINREVALAQLAKLGYHAEAVCNGLEAAEAVERGTCDLVLMDCEMPVMDGFEATGRIRNSVHPEIPVIAMTAHSMSGDTNRCLAAGMNDFISKPVDLQRLAELLAKWRPVAKEIPEAGNPREITTVSATPGFDSADLLLRLMGDHALASAVLQGFIGDFPNLLRNLRERFAEEGLKGAAGAAHTLKGAAATSGASKLSAVASQLELAANSSAGSRFSELLPRVQLEFEQFVRDVEQSGILTFGSM